MPGLYNLIVAMGLAFPGPAAAQEKENPDRPNILVTFGQARLVHRGCGSAMSVSRRGSAS
jgi:hypothetical protein